jgi:hypothetical protein
MTVCNKLDLFQATCFIIKDQVQDADRQTDNERKIALSLSKRDRERDATRLTDS